MVPHKKMNGLLLLFCPAFLVLVNGLNPVKRTRPSPHTLPRYAHLRGRDTELTSLRGACELWCKRCVAYVRR